MKPEEFLKTLSDIDPRYIGEAEAYVKKKRSIPWKRYTAIAASVCVVVTGGYLFVYNSGGTKDMSSGATNTDTLDKGVDSSTEESSNIIPETIYINEDCYKRVESNEEYNKETLSYLGEVGEEDTDIHSDSEIIGSSVYRIDDTRIMVEINGKYYTYKK